MERPGPAVPPWGWGSGRRSLQGLGDWRDSCPPPDSQAEGEAFLHSAGEDELASAHCCKASILGYLKVVFTYFLNKHL